MILITFVFSKMRGFLFHIFLLSSIYLQAQSSVYENELKIKGGFGTLLPHRSTMKHLHTGHAKALEVSYNFNTYGEKLYHQAYNYPQLGIAAGIYDIGNPEDIGLTYSITPTVSIPFSKNKFLPQLKIGVGLGIVSKPFGTNDNYRNVAIGSYLNASILFELEKSVRLSEKLKLYYSASMMHYSNGATSLPNLGLNTITFNTGISYAFGQKKNKVLIEEKTIDKTIEFTPFVYGGWRKNTVHVPVRYGVGLVSLEFNKQINRKGNWLFGADLIYNSSVEHLDELNHLEENIDYLKKGSNIQSGIFTGYTFVMDDVELVVQLGMYTYNEYKGRGLLYQRTSVRKHFGDKIIANVGLKSHLAVAEYVEFGLGYRF